jgi:hypothetical protein
MVPDTADVVTFTVCMLCTIPQLVLTVYDIEATPALLPVTVPDADTLATDGSDELHVPPATSEAKPMVSPVQTLPEPVILPAVGAGLKVTVMVVKQPEDAA